MKSTHMRNSNPCGAIPQDMARFNMLDLHETLHTLSQRHQFSHNNCTGQIQNHNKHTTNVVSLQRAGFQRNMAHTASMLSSCAQKKSETNAIHNQHTTKHDVTSSCNTGLLAVAAHRHARAPRDPARAPRAVLESTTTPTSRAAGAAAI